MPAAGCCVAEATARQKAPAPDFGGAGAYRHPFEAGGRVHIDRPLPFLVLNRYPDVAISARIRGVVILEANVDKDGRVVEVKVLRTANVLLDAAAITAVRQWQYRPLILNGLPEPFVLTVVLTFDLREDS